MKDQQTLVFKSLFLSVLLSCSLAVNAKYAECNKPLTLSITSDWYPYIYQTANGKSSGVDVVLLKTILNNMHCQLDVIHFPERRMLFELNVGNYDIGLGASKVKKRMSLFYYSESYRNEKNKFVYRVNDRDIATMKNFDELMLAKKTIAINYAGWYGDEIENAKARYGNFSYSATAKKRLKMLNARRVDVVIDDDIVLCSELLANDNSNVVLHPSVLFETSIHFIFSKKTVSIDFVQAFNNVLKQMKNDGSLAKHYQEYLPKGCHISATKA